MPIFSGSVADKNPSVLYYVQQYRSHILYMAVTFDDTDICMSRRACWHGEEGFPGLLAKEHSVRQMSDWFSTGCVGSVDSQPLKN
ncbi:unnamed protein product [Wuchereria bancrofti]|uniref:Uncharacterized protein n=1 Tax=Wuchereria bancrofti TaxID=6293 RepID=A0A3P7EDN9_WUCBA|nr:unnamed protein product [Wuchereria bancrofti]